MGLDDKVNDIQDYIKFKKKLEQYVMEQTINHYKEYSELPTIRDLSRRYILSQKTILQMVEDSDCLDFNIGIRVGSGIGEFRRIGDYTVEWAGDIA